MAKNKYELELKIAADVADIKKATQELEAFKNKFNATYNQIKTGFNLNFGAGIGNQIKNIVGQALPNYLKQEKAEIGLAQAMKNTKIYSDESLESFKKLATQIQGLTTIGDETVLSMQSMALNMGISKDKMQECIEGAIGLQTAYGMGLNEAIKASAAVIKGASSFRSK